MTVGTSLPPLVKRLRVRLAPAPAFDLFTRELARWWPLATHSCFGAEAANVIIEPRVGGQVLETGRDGRTAPWGVVLEWDPPYRFSMSWHPAHDPAAATRVDVRFAAVEDGGSELELVHSGWEARGDEADSVRGRYDGGWATVLARYAAEATER